MVAKKLRLRKGFYMEIIIPSTEAKNDFIPLVCRGDNHKRFHTFSQEEKETYKFLREQGAC